jgi:acetolactate synthase-1/3 small subunit
MLQTFAIEIENNTLAFERVVSAVRRRAFAIRSLSFRGTRRAGIARIVFAVDADERDAQRLEHNLWKLLDVIEVKRSARDAGREEASHSLPFFHSLGG